MYHFAKYPSFYSFFFLIPSTLLDSSSSSPPFQAAFLTWAFCMCTTHRWQLDEKKHWWKWRGFSKFASLSFRNAYTLRYNIRLYGSLITSRRYEFYSCSRVYVYIFIMFPFKKEKRKERKGNELFLNIISLFSVEKNASSKATRKWQSLPRVSLVSHFYKVSILVTRIRHLFLFLKIFFIDSTHGLLELEVYRKNCLRHCFYIWNYDTCILLLERMKRINLIVIIIKSIPTVCIHTTNRYIFIISF